MVKQFLIEELSNINAARVHRMRVANLVLASKNRFKPLLEIVFEIHNPISVKAAWVLEFVVHKKMNWLLTEIDYFSLTLNPQECFYCKVKLHAIFGNAQKNLLTISSDMFALLFSVPDQY